MASLSYSEERFQPGDRVIITTGVFADYEGNVDSVNPLERQIDVSMNIYGRQTPVRCNFSEARRVL
jgi:transcriptional antiterminator NusG